MAYRRFKKTYRKRRTFKRRAFKKRGIVKRSRKGMNVHYFKRTQAVTIPLVQAPWYPISHNNINFNNYTLGEINGVSEFTTLFDEYKICGIKHRIVFDKNSTDLGTTSFPIPELFMVNDYNDQSSLTTEGQALQYGNLKIKRLLAPIYKYFRPSQNILSGTSAVTTQTKSRWNSTAQTDIIHSGFKMSVRNNLAVSPTVYGNITIYTTWYIGCRNVR